MHKTLINTLAGLSAALACVTAQATQSGADTIGAGAEGFLAGALPPAGWYGVFYYTHYQAKRFNDDAGNASVPGFKLQADVLVPRLLYMSDRTLWGGRLGGFALAPLPSLSLDAGGEHERRSGLGDAVLGPVLAWGDAGPLHTVLAADIVLPTGSYDRDRMLNLGANHYSLRPVFAFSYLPASGWELSSKISYTFNGKNRDIDYQSGQQFHFDYSLSYAAGPAWRLGLNGYFIKQTTDDTQHGQAVAGNGFRGQAFAIGPALRYQFDKAGLELRWLKEFEVRNRPEGDALWLKLVLPL